MTARANGRTAVGWAGGRISALGTDFSPKDAPGWGMAFWPQRGTKTNVL
jgi:hypothetical protein